MLQRRVLIAALLLGTSLVTASTTAGQLSLVDLLQSYMAGRFDVVTNALAGDVDYGDILEQFRRDAPAWIGAAAPAERARRELTAATVALEAARAGARREWKLIQKQPPMCLEGIDDCYQPLNVLYWKAPPLLIEWGCELLRRDEIPRPIERWWQLAAVSVAQRAEDPQFLVGDTNIGRGVEAGEIGNLQHEIKHLDHVMARFPEERRFVLAQGIARDRDWPEDATQAYESLAGDPDVGGEAMMRLGAMRLRQGGLDEALKALERADRLTRDPYVVYLARYFEAQVHERQKDVERAQAAYRGAAAAVPRAQSATVALAALTLQRGRRDEAHRLIRGMLDADPRPRDPWHTYAQADDRFWPQLVGRLRAEILK